MKDRRRFAGLIAMLAFAASDASAQSAASDWPRWRGPNGDGIAAQDDWNPKALAGGPKVLWKAQVGDGFSSVAIVGDRLYTMGNNTREDAVVCLDARNGKEIWRYAYPCRQGEYPGPRATPTVDGDLVYAMSREGLLLCLRARDGRLVWKLDIAQEFGARAPTWGFAGSAVTRGDLLVVNACRSGIALDKRTGRKVWASEAGTCGYATPVFYVFGGRECAAFFGSTALYGVELATGAVLWSHPWRTANDVNAADPLVIGNRIFISSDYGRGCTMLEITDKGPKALWEHTAVASQFSGFVHRDGYIYANSGNANYHRGEYVCLEAQTGKVMWTRDMGLGSLLLSGDTLLLLTETRTLAAARAVPGGYEEIASCRLEKGLFWTPPVLLHGRIYARSMTGELYCVGAGG